jgi:hypothetical protein
VHEFVVVEPDTVLFNEFLDGLVELTFQRSDEQRADYLIGNDYTKGYEDIFDRSSNHCFRHPPSDARLSHEPEFLQ